MKRKLMRKIPLILLLGGLINLLLIVSAPFTIPPGTVRGLDGRANVMDYEDRWEKLPPYPRLAYTVGDLNCHQKDSRSFHLNGNQLPVCARDTGMAFGFVFGALSLMYAIPDGDLFRMALTPMWGNKALSMGKKKAAALALLLGAVLMAPMVVDGMRQALTPYESTNTVRFVTGLFFGTALTFGFGCYMESFVYRVLYVKEDQ